MRPLLLVAIAITSSTALAQPETPEPETREITEPEPPEVEAEPAPGDPVHTAASVVDQPRPGEAAAIAVGPDRSGEWALWIPRVLLFPFRAIAEVIDYPIRKGIYAYEVYDLKARVKSIFFNEEGTAGLYPVAFVETGFGLNAGARLILRDLFGSDAEITGRASFGGRFRQLYSLELDTEESWERFRFDVGLVAELRPKDQFWGIGDGDERQEAPAMPVDPLAVDFLRQTRFKQRALRAVFGSEYRPHRFVRARASAALIDRVFDPADEDDVDDDQLIEDTFDTAAIPGFEEGSRHLYAELELGLDTRAAPSYWEGPSTPSAGFLIAAFAGRAFAIDSGSSSYNRYGLDAQRYIRLGA